MQKDYKNGTELDHDYPINDDYEPYELFKQCKPEPHANTPFYLAYDILAGEGELPRPSTKWQSQYGKDWRETLNGNTANMYVKSPNGHFSDDSQPIYQNKRPTLLVDERLTISPAITALNCYLHLPTNFD